jgi:tetratricopeptide (TPR) repeat protein
MPSSSTIAIILPFEWSVASREYGIETNSGVLLDPFLIFGWGPFPELGVIVSPLLEQSVVHAGGRQYGVSHLYGIRPFPDDPAMTELRKTLEAAEQLYGQRDLDKAKQTYMRVLQESDEKPLHASAYYGLARIAVLQKDPETAERLFQKTLESSPEPQVTAWTLVYLGRLSDARGDGEQARRHYQSALGVEGASMAARKAAEQGAQQNLQKQN